MKYFPAPAVQDIAELLIPKYHDSLVDIRIDYVFCDTTPKRGGKEVWGSMQRISSLPAYLGADKADRDRGANDPFYVMTITDAIWQQLNHKERTALVDHELCHAEVEFDQTGEPKLKTVGHDVEEFKAIIERYGLWRPSIKAFVDTANGEIPSTNEEDVSDEES